VSIDLNAAYNAEGWGLEGLDGTLAIIRLIFAYDCCLRGELRNRTGAGGSHRHERGRKELLSKFVLDPDVPNGCDTSEDADYVVFESNRFRTLYVAVKVRPSLELNIEEEQVGFQLLKRLVDLQTRQKRSIRRTQLVPANSRSCSMANRSSST
jgi:hypothetical protein